MDGFIRLFYSFIAALMTLYVLSRLIPKLKKQPKTKHGITVLYLSTFMTIYNVSSIEHVLVYYASLMMILIAFYKNSMFVSSMSVLFLYVITLLGSMGASNLTLLIASDVVDFRAIFASGNLTANIIYILLVFALIGYYRVIVRLFKKVSGTNFKFDRMMLFSNVILFALVFAYQRMTFTNMVEFSAGGIINTPGVERYNGYFLLTYAFVTLTSLFLVVIINRQFIVDKNLENYKFKAETDLMTGALSREAGLQHLKAEMARAVQYKFDLTIAYVDVNDLKAVNDQYGHKEGDKLIKVISDTIHASLREFDVVARLGGDEFLIVFTRCNKAQASRVWRRITEEFLKVNLSGKCGFKVSASVGITQYNPAKHTTMLSLVHEADEEMYAQKKSIKASQL